MIEKFEQSSGNTIGYKISGTISKDDYAVMVPEVEALVDQVGDINMLLDLSEFHWEKVSAWGADMKFGSTYRKKINKLAIIGDKKWQNLTAWLSQPFFAHEEKYFDTADSEAAWTWLKEV